jgi:ribonuclease D
VAIDTEFHAERRYVPELYLVQIHVPGGPGEPGDTWIVDPLRDDLLARLAEPLRGVPWVVHAGEQDLKVLSVALGGLPAVVLDTQIAAGLVSNHWPAPYQALTARYLRVKLEKGETLSDWSRRPLTPAQLQYAALDVQHLLPLWDRLAEALDTLDRREPATLACDEARCAALDGPDPTEAFREIGAAPTLDPPSLRVLQELAGWRLKRAIATNQPVRSVLADGVLVDLARRKPITEGSMRENRRMPKRLGRDAAQIVELIVRATHRPEGAVPPIVRRRTPQWRSAAWLQLWGEWLGEARSFAAGFVLPRRLVDALVSDPPPDRAAICDRLTWRDPLCGDALLDALGGRVRLRLSGPDVAAE